VTGAAGVCGAGAGRQAAGSGPSKAHRLAGAGEGKGLVRQQGDGCGLTLLDNDLRRC